MRHANHNRKLGRVRKVRSGLMKSLAYSLILKEKIKTTDAKARELRPMVEKLVTLAKKTGEKQAIASRRLLVSRVGAEAAGKLVKDVAPRFATRAGGYTRITKLPARAGDASLMAVIEFV